MKSIKQSRIDRLERRRVQSLRNTGMTGVQLVKEFNKILKRVEKDCIRLGKKKCPHGLAFSGYECFICKPDDIANRIRKDWFPIPSYDLEVIPIDDEEVYIPITVKTNNIAETIRNMQQNGFWYKLHNEPMYLMPKCIRCIIVKNMVQNPDCIDPGVKPSSRASKQIQSFQK